MITSSTPVTSSTPAPAGQAPGGTLGKDDFLRLLATELQYQDPLSPTDNKDFMSQMAQFSALEQMTNVATGMGQLAASSTFAEAVGLLGKQVGYTRDDGSAATGTATGVSVANGAVTVTVGADEVGLDAIQTVGTDAGGATAS